jgi:surfactin synthase thioesterase subunit
LTPGKTKVEEETIMDIEALAGDLIAVLKEVFPDKQACPKLVLVGHSMVSTIYVSYVVYI